MAKNRDTQPDAESWVDYLRSKMEPRRGPRTYSNEEILELAEQMGREAARKHNPATGGAPDSKPPDAE